MPQTVAQLHITLNERYWEMKPLKSSELNILLVSAICSIQYSMERSTIMGYIADEVHRAITDNHLKSHVLPLEYVDDLRMSIVKQYCTKNTTHMWECFKNCVNYQNSNAWSLICDYVKDNECIMFFNESDDKNAFLIPNGAELQKILEDSFGFEFYITNKNYSYLICFNHHDILYGSGEAKEWVRRLNI